MKLLKRILPAVLLVAAFVLAAAPQAAAQFRIGPRLGLTVNKLHFDEKVFDSDNRAGFTGGLMMEFTVPVIGVGMDLSALYVRRDARWMENNDISRSHRDYIDIPLNLKWKLNIPLINKVFRPFLTTGPDFAFLTSRKAINAAYKNKSTNISWNFGFGAEIVSHLQIGASYGLGLSKTIDAVSSSANLPDIDGKNRYWMVTATWLF